MNAESELARCARELAEIREQTPTPPAYKAAMGELDWKIEAALIEAEHQGRKET